MKCCVCCGQQGYFIPKEEFKQGLWLNEEQKNLLHTKIEENDKLIQSLKEDLKMSGEE